LAEPVFFAWIILRRLEQVAADGGLRSRGEVAWLAPPLSHEEMLETGRNSAARMGRLLAQVLGRL
jgi:hypothetical protein